MLNETDTKIQVSEGVASQSRLGIWLRRYHWLVALVLYTLVIVGITYPLIFRLNENLIGYAQGDGVWFTWLLWWFKHAIETGQDPARTNYIFGLLPSVQIFMDTFYNELLAFPLQWLLTPVGAYNVLTLSGFVLSGITTYYLAAEFVPSKIACFVAGFLYSFSTYHMVRAPSHISYATLQWLPFFAWCVFVFYRRPSLKNATFMGLSLVLIPFSDLYYVAYFLLPFSLLFLIGKLLTDFRWFKQPRHLLLGGFGLLLGLVLALPPLLGFLMVDPDVQITARLAASSAELFSADLLEFFFPFPYNPFVGDFTAVIYAITGPNKFETSTYLGFVSLWLGLSALLSPRTRNRVTAFWLVLGLVGLILAMGPKINIAGQTLFESWPYKFIFNLPFLSNFRAPGRIVVLPMLALAILAAFTVNEWMRRLKNNQGRRIIMIGLLAFFLTISLAEHMVWAFPYPATAIPTSELYPQIAADPIPGLVLDLPLQTTSPYQSLFTIRNQYYQTLHHKPIVGGVAPRTSELLLSSITNIPYLAEFKLLLNGKAAEAQGEIYPTKISFKQGLQENRVRYVILRRNFDTPFYSPILGPAVFEQTNYDNLNRFLQADLGQPFYQSEAENITAWKIEPIPPPDPTRYQFKLGSGWAIGMKLHDAKIERLVEQKSQLLISAPQVSKQPLRFTATSYFKPMTLQVRLNGVLVNTTRFDQPSQTQMIDLGQIELKPGQNILEFDAPEGCSRPSTFSDQTSDTRCYSFGIGQLEMK